MNRNSRFCLGAVLAVLILAGCGATQPAATPTSTSAHGTPASTSTRSTPMSLDHIVIIVEENESSASILGNPDAPYLNRLATDYALAGNYQAVTHPSLPNYLALTSGTTAGITSDCNPGGPCTADVPSIAGEIDKSGRSWKMYAEGMPAPCTAENTGNYAVKHNPFMYYPSVTGDGAYCAAHVVPFSQFGTDLASAATLPNYAFISPDLCHDMHNCPVGTGDAWLAEQVPAILASPAFTEQNSLLVITWDEGSGADNTVVTIFAGPAAKKGYRTDAAYGHYSLLHTIEDAWGLAPLTDNDRKAPVMNEMLR